MTAINDKDILLMVEDNTFWSKNFISILKRIGESRSIAVCDIDEFTAQYSAGRDFENVAACFVDLELMGDIGPEVSDLSGLKQILPKIRSMAPWIPAACISRYIGTDGSIVGLLSSSDFDFFVAKKMIVDDKRTHAEFNQQSWQDTLRSMQIKRIAGATGRSTGDVFDCLSTLPDLTLEAGAEKAIADAGISNQVFLEGLSSLGLEGSELTVEALQPGFSGLQICRVRAMGRSGEDSVAADWLLKWGRPIHKLAEEAAAHKLYFRRGLDRALQIPQLHPNVITWCGVGFLAYAFEKDAQTALEFVGRSGVEGLEPVLTELASSMYSTVRRKSIIARKEIGEWISSGSQDGRSRGAGIREGVFDISWSLIHGDLHLRNIFVRGVRPTLIDFARAGFGPVAIDAAKLVIDALAFAIPAGAGLPRHLNTSGLLESALCPVFRPFQRALTAPDDAELLDGALAAYARRYLEYPDVPKDKKEVIEMLIKG